MYVMYFLFFSKIDRIYNIFYHNISYQSKEYWNLGSNNRLDWKELSKHKTIFKMV